MSLDDVFKWAQLANLLLFPIAAAIINMRILLAKALTKAEAHEELDNQRFETHNEALDRAHHGIAKLREIVSTHDVSIAVIKERGEHARTRATDG